MDWRVVGDIMEKAGEDDVVREFVERSVEEREFVRSMSLLN
jgi:hypothetical protein